MSVERIIGVDFGTSTSVIRVKRYEDGKPVGDRLETKAVTFNMGSTIVPTLVQKLKTGESAYFGYDAEVAHKNTKTYQNFKVDIENPDEYIRRQARELTAEYFSFLAKTYKVQSEGGHLGKSDDKERTIISYPVKWSKETKAFMVKAAKDAGFVDVEGIDEAQAAIQAVTVQNAELLTGKGYFKDGVPVNILLIDMGAGTTDLVLCRHTPGNHPKTDILSIWPKGESFLFGGREIDERLRSYICQTLPKEDADIILKKIGTEKYKAWKESIVSPALQRGEKVDYFAALDDLLSLLEIETEYSIDRESLERYMEDYLRNFPELVNGCVKAAGIKGKDVDLVILTGGHSQWYFVPEILSGKMEQFGKTGLEKIRTDPSRIIPIALPQETVALGMVYGMLRVRKLVEPLLHVARKEPTCTEKGNVEFWFRKSDNSFFTDRDGIHKINPLIPELGHSFEWIVENGQKVQKCKRCGCIGQREQIEKPPVSPQVINGSAQIPDTPDSEFLFNNVGGNYEIIKYTGKASVVKIPECIRGRKVVSIGKHAFGANNGYGIGANKKVEKVIIPTTVTHIGEWAFAHCTNLKTVIAHNNIVTIGFNAFLNCNKLEIMDFGMGECIPHIVTFPPDLKEIGSQAFNSVGLSGIPKCIFHEVNLSKKTKLKSLLGMSKAFSEKNCAIFYYD